LEAQGKLDEALKCYREAASSAERLLAHDRSNNDWQNDLSVFYGKVGDALEEQGKLDEALKAYRDSLAIMEQVAGTDRSNTMWQGNLSSSYWKIGYTLEAQGKLDEALKGYRDSIAILKPVVARDRSNIQWQHDLEIMIESMGGLAYKFVLARSFSQALNVAEEAIALAPEKIWLYTNRAHALMFLGRTDQARTLYLKYRSQQKVEGDKSWKAVILEEFAELQKAGLRHPLMVEIVKDLAGS
jgi:tetratricopeptide (TPR) repeat protein